LGDNDSTWDHLVWSIAEVLAMGLYGVTMVGADICGFGSNTTPELCARWIQLGSLYPFARDHSTTGSTDQEAYRFGEPYVSANRNSLKLRYSLLPYIYRLYEQSHLLGYPVWRALAWQYPTDPATYAIDSQFLLGDALLGIPIITQGATSVKGYLPNDDWFDYYSHARLTYYSGSVTTGTSMTFNDTLSANSRIPLLQRGGTIVPTQRPAATTYETVSQPYTLNVALDVLGAALGSIVLDDGETIGNIDIGDYYLVDFASIMIALGGKPLGILTQITTQSASNYSINGLFIEAVTVMGLDLMDGVNVDVPTLMVDGERVPLTGVQVSVRNGALMVIDPSVSLIPVASDWSLTFGLGSEEEEEAMMKKVQMHREMKAASE